jgi:Ca2+-binding EF-hand superfamily protein
MVCRVLATAAVVLGAYLPLSASAAGLMSDTRAKRADARFNAADADKNGVLGRVEIDSLGIQAYAEFMKRLGAWQLKSGSTAVPKTYLRYWDSDGNGIITRAEYRSKWRTQPQRKLMDADGDGTVTRDEHHNFYTVAEQIAGVHSGPLMGLDSDSDGKISRAESEGKTLGERASSVMGKRISSADAFKDADADKSGDVSADELVIYFHRHLNPSVKAATAKKSPPSVKQK